jgi:hypothetical protein
LSTYIPECVSVFLVPLSCVFLAMKNLYLVLTVDFAFFGIMSAFTRKKKKTSDKKTYPLDLLLPSASQSAVKLFTLPLHISSCYFQPFGESNA